jgi:hypothetical protein
MVVRLDAGREAIREYVRQQAGLGLNHVKAQIRADRDAIVAVAAGLSDDEANFRPSDDEYSVLQVLQHLNGSFERSADRLSTLSSGRSWLNTGPAPGPGNIPAYADSDYAEVYRHFVEGEDRILVILDQAGPGVGLNLTADHAQYGPFNWLEWAVYSHHVHTHDHVGQIEQLGAAIEARKASSGPR